MDQAVDAAVQTDEDTEVGDRLDNTGDTIALAVGRGKRVPGVLLALLDAQGDAAALLVDVENHDFDFVAELHDLRRVDVLVGPVHLGHVDQALDTVFDFDETAVIGDVRDLAEQAGAHRVAARDARVEHHPTPERPLETWRLAA